MRFRVLGVVEAVDDAVMLTSNGRRQRLLLKSLPLDTNQVVPPAQLIDRLWPADPPAGADHARPAAVSRLRAAL